MTTPQQPWPGQDQRHQGGPRQPGYQRGFPQQGPPAAPEPPDYLALAGAQLYLIAQGIDKMAASIGEHDDKVREARFRLAEALTALADIQYGALDDSEDEDLDAEYQR